MDDPGGAERRRLARRDEDYRYAVLERLVAQHRMWFEQMGVQEASDRERQSWVHLARWWVRGEDTRGQRRRMIAAVVALSTIVGPILGALITFLLAHLTGAVH